MSESRICVVGKLLQNLELLELSFNGCFPKRHGREVRQVDARGTLGWLCQVTNGNPGERGHGRLWRGRRTVPGVPAQTPTGARPSRSFRSATLAFVKLATWGRMSPFMTLSDICVVEHMKCTHVDFYKMMFLLCKSSENRGLTGLNTPLYI
jgi:hypothetical protein